MPFIVTSNAFMSLSTFRNLNTTLARAYRMCSALVPFQSFRLGSFVFGCICKGAIGNLMFQGKNEELSKEQMDNGTLATFVGQN